MYSTHLSHLALESLRSEILLETNLASVLNKKMLCQSTKDELYQNFNSRYGDRWRLFEIKNSLDKLYVNKNNISLNFLEDMSSSYFDYYATNVTLKDGFNDEYSLICSKIHPYFIIGYKFAQDYLKNKDSSYIGQVAKNLIPLILPVDYSVKFAENHMHFGGAHDPSTLLIRLANETCNNSKCSLERKSLSSPTNIYTMKELLLIYRGLFASLNNEKTQTKTLSELKFLLGGLRNPIFTSASNFQDIYNYNLTADPLLSLCSEFYHFEQFPQSLFVYIVWLLTQYISGKNAELILSFIIVVNIIRSDIVMGSATGLEQFVNLFKSKIISADAKTKFSTAKDVFSAGVSYLEYRHSTDSHDLKYYEKHFKMLSGGIAAIVDKKYQHLFVKDRKFLKNNIIPFDTDEIGFHYYYHFQKVQDKESLLSSPLCQIRHLEYRKGVHVKVKNIIKWLQCGRSQESLYDIHDCSLQNLYNDDIKLLRTTSIDFRQMLRGIDAAGNEILTAPDIFAPYVRLLRGKQFVSEVEKYNSSLHSIKPLVLAFHAGEDFSHIATGMRRIDETVDFMEYKKYDRLGHALAIGITPHDWINSYKEICISKQDRLDDLVWLWKKAILLNDPFSKMLELTAQKLGVYIYGDHWHILDAYESWKLRRNCPLHFFDKTLHDYKYILKDDPVKIKGTNPYKLYEAYHKSIDVREKGKEVIFIRDNKSFNNCPANVETITEEELNFLEKVQDFQLEEYANKGIIIEISISSNMYISRIPDLSNHPVFRWFPINRNVRSEESKKYNKFGLRKSVNEVCLNTDDPGIFQTTLQNEFKLLENCASCSGSNQYDIKKWINDIREMGITLFKFNHQTLYYNSFII